MELKGKFLNLRFSYALLCSGFEKEKNAHGFNRPVAERRF